MNFHLPGGNRTHSGNDYRVTTIHTVMSAGDVSRTISGTVGSWVWLSETAVEVAVLSPSCDNGCAHYSMKQARVFC